MASITQIRGMLLEEAVLFLLRKSGYQTVKTPGADPSLENGPAGLCVKGRGEKHQIDAIADFVFVPPFSHRQRLLVEAKCYTSKDVGIEEIRNAVGVWKDVSEFWVPDNRAVLQMRYHYQYALFSASGFTRSAQNYAYAHDIYLLPLAQSRFIRSLVEAIRHLGHADFGAGSWNKVGVNLSQLRSAMRDGLTGGDNAALEALELAPAALSVLNAILETARSANGAVLGMIEPHFPVFLAPAPNINIDNFARETPVRISWDDEGWSIRDAQTELELFSFDLPEHLLTNYLVGDRGLDRLHAIDLKRAHLREIQVLYAPTNRSVSVLTLTLDEMWLDDVRERLLARRREARDQ